ncbi:MAG TPA: MDR family oxidoreductase [Candidimonas sp.]|nr:MDR family oxidoreductase [Candidimonas sp.]
MFKGLILQKNDDGTTHASFQDIEASRLPAGDVEIQIAYSTLNYKDALAITGKGPVVRHWPMVPGIDLAGIVLNSSDASFEPGTAVLVNGHGMGEMHWGGLAEKARVPAAWLTKLPQALSNRDAMAIGTAGYTAMLSVLALHRQGIHPDSGPILVTGANGGVGSFAIALLARRGYHVVASTGRTDKANRLQLLGAKEIIDRQSLGEKGKPLQKELWAGAIDSVGSHTLANVCAQMRYGGVVTACGLAQGLDFQATVAPFILRGVALIGIDSVYAPKALRDEAWQCLAKETDPAMLSTISAEIPLNQTIEAAQDLLAGKITGRVLVKVGA